MAATLNLYSLTVAYGDAQQSNNPALKHVDWKRSIPGLAVENPKIEGVAVPPGVEKLIFDGSRSTAIDGTTAFSLALSPLAADLYRLTATGGTAPAFRTNRSLALSGVALTFTAQANESMLVAAGAGTPFSTLQVGDEVFFAGLMTGDASSPFSAMNQGRWVVLGVGASGANVTLRRAGDFQGLTELVTPTDNAQVLGFSSDGVQVGDSLELSAGFAAPALNTYEVAAVTPSWIEFKFSSPLAPQTGILPTAAGFKLYSSGKRFLRVETDQEAVLRLNGDTSSVLRLSPWLSGDPAQVAEYQQVGPVWSLKILNKSSLTLNAVIVTVE